MFGKNVELMSNFYGSQCPPVIKLLMTPIIVIWWIIITVISILMWTLGFWSCEKCKRTFPFYIRNYPYYAGGSMEDGPDKYIRCYKCKK